MAKRKAKSPSLVSEDEIRQYVEDYHEQPLESLDRWRQKLAELVKPHLSDPVAEPESKEPGDRYLNLDLGNGLKWYIVDPDVTERPKDLKRAGEAKIKMARYAIDALIQIFLISVSSHEPTVFRATVLLGTYFERMRIAPYEDLILEGARTKQRRKIGLKRAIEVRRKGTAGPKLQAHEWMTEYLESNSQRGAADQTRKRFQREQNATHGVSTIIGWYKEVEAECAAT